jgi:hypothetical protein
MSAVSRHSVESSRESEARRVATEEAASENFWQWFALIVLLACWLAEASM